MSYKRTHPVFILEGIQKLVLLLVVPLLRGFAAALQGGFYSWLSGAWVDVSVVLVILLLATLRWWLTRYAFNGKTVAVRGGLISFVEKQVPLEEICSVTCESPWFYRPFSATRMRFETLAGTRRRADISLILPTDKAVEILKLTSQKINMGRNELRKTYAPRLLYIMIISAFLSDSFAGAGFAAAFFTKAGSLVGEGLKERMIDTLNSFARLLWVGVGPVATAAAIIILGGWLVGFFQNLIRHHNLTLTRDKNTVEISGGAFTRRTTLVRVDSIDFINIKQGLFTKILGVYTVFGHCVGVGKKREDITTFTPAGNRKEINESFRLLFPEFKRSKITVRPNRTSVFRFVADPIWPCTILPTATAVLMRLLPDWTDVILFAGVFVSIPAYWWLIVRVADFFTSGIGANEATVTLKYSTFLQFNTAIIPWEKIVTIKLRQSLFQRLDKRCDVFVYTKGETPYRHRVRNVDVKTARKLLRI